MDTRHTEQGSLFIDVVKGGGEKTPFYCENTEQKETFRLMFMSMLTSDLTSIFSDDLRIN